MRPLVALSLLAFLVACSAPLDVGEGEGEGEGEPAQNAVPFLVDGYGRATRGGWQPGHVDVVVTNLDDDGPGSLRDALRTDGTSRVVTFAVSGSIALTSALLVPSHVSVDGAGADITLVGKGLVLGGSDDVILTRLTIADVAPDTDDGVQIGSTTDPAVGVVLDHLTFVQTGANNNGSSKFVDEAVSVISGSHDVTIQDCRFEDWEKAMLFGNGDAPAALDDDITVTVVRNVFTGTGRRHPQARFGSFDVVNNLMFDWHFFESPFSEPFPECFGAQIQDQGRMRFENDVVSRGTHTFDDAPFVSQAHDVTCCESGGVLDERGTFVRADNTDDALAFGVGCTAGTVERPYALDVAVADEALALALALELLSSSGNL